MVSGPQISSAHLEAESLSGLPDAHAPEFDRFAGSLVVDLEQPTPDARLEAHRALPVSTDPVARAVLPPAVDLFGEHFEGRGGIHCDP